MPPEFTRHEPVPQRHYVSTGSPWEERYRFARAVRAANHIQVAGTLLVNDDGSPGHPGDAYRQAVGIFEKIRGALEPLGASLADVVRTRMFITDVAHCDDVGRAHAEAFGDAYPAATMLVVAGLVLDGALVEIEAEAILQP